MATVEVLRRSLCSARLGPMLCLEALRWETPLGAGMRIYFGRGGVPDDLGADKGSTVRFTQIAPVAGSLVASGTVASPQAPFRLAIAGDVHEVAAAVPEATLFDDLNVLLAQRHLETPGQVADWLDYHVRDNGANAALLVNRAEPGPGNDAFAAELAEAVQGIGGLVRVLLVEAPLPLGREGQPALGDPGTAPRASGHDPKPDPWLAPLAEPLLYDALKWRFLSRAGAVLALEPCDLLDGSGDGVSVFEKCRQSQNGLIVLEGEQVFAWRIRKGRAPAHGDHICRAIPKVRAPDRWCVAPKRTGPETLWLPGKIAGIETVPEEPEHYSRAASVCFPASAPAELIDKARLVEHARLLKRATDRLGHDPVRPPERAGAMAKTPKPMPSGRTVIVTCMKNEGPFILEWLAYHRMIGVDDFLVYTNDCDDGTDTMLDVLQARGLVQRRDNPFRDSQDQAAVGGACRRRSPNRWCKTRAGSSRWMSTSFSTSMPARDGWTTFMRRSPRPALISITWRLFGNSDIDRFEDRLVTEQFTRCAPQLIRRPHQAWGFKTLFRNNGLFDSFRGAPAQGVQGAGRGVGQRVGPADAAGDFQGWVAQRHRQLRLRSGDAEPLFGAQCRKLPGQARPGPGQPCHARSGPGLLVADEQQRRAGPVDPAARARRCRRNWTG